MTSLVQARSRNDACARARINRVRYKSVHKVVQTSLMPLASRLSALYLIDYLDRTGKRSSNKVGPMGMKVEIILPVDERNRNVSVCTICRAHKERTVNRQVFWQQLQLNALLPGSLTALDFVSLS